MAISREPEPVEDWWLEQAESNAKSAEGRSRWRSFEGDSQWLLQHKLHSTCCTGFKEHTVLTLAVKADLEPLVRTYACRW